MLSALLFSNWVIVMQWNSTRKALAKTYFWILVVGISYFCFIQLTGWSIPCVTYRYLGILCPGCGLTRMAVNLVQGHFATAFSYHPLGCIALPLWLVASVLGFWGKPKFTQHAAFWKWLGTITLVAALLFTILRNL